MNDDTVMTAYVYLGACILTLSVVWIWLARRAKREQLAFEAAMRELLEADRKRPRAPTYNGRGK
jgi:hypothetical protein